MTTPKKPTSNRNTISRHEFMRLCEWMRDNKPLIEAQTTYVNAHKMVVEQSGMTVALNAVREAMSFLGMKLSEPPKKAQPNPGATQILARALIKLHGELNVEPSAELLELVGMATEQSK